MKLLNFFSSTNWTKSQFVKLIKLKNIKNKLEWKGTAQVQIFWEIDPGNVIMSQAHESKMAASLFQLTQIFSKQN